MPEPDPIILHREGIREIHWGLARRTRIMITDMEAVRTYNDALNLAERFEAVAKEIRDIIEGSRAGTYPFTPEE